MKNVKFRKSKISKFHLAVFDPIPSQVLGRVRAPVWARVLGLVFRYPYSERCWIFSSAWFSTVIFHSIWMNFYHNVQVWFSIRKRNFKSLIYFKVINNRKIYDTFCVHPQLNKFRFEKNVLIGNVFSGDENKYKYTRILQRRKVKTVNEKRSRN